ncbi:MAG: hypothetical protein QXJ64_10780 [Thermosphaera sp.]
MKQVLKTAVPLLLIGCISFASGIAFSNQTKKPSFVAQTNLPIDTPSLNNAMMPEGEIHRLGNLYLKYRDSIQDKYLTTSIILNPQIFEFIGDRIKEGNGNIEAIKLIMIRYDDKYADPKIIKSGQTAIYGKTHGNQNSIAIVPVIKGKVDYNAWLPFPVEKRGLFKISPKYKSLFDGFNHGALCPDSCYAIN